MNTPFSSSLLFDKRSEFTVAVEVQMSVLTAECLVPFTVKIVGNFNFAFGTFVLFSLKSSINDFGQKLI